MRIIKGHCSVVLIFFKFRHNYDLVLSKSPNHVIDNQHSQVVKMVERKALPLVIMTGFWGVVGIVLPIIVHFLMRGSPNKG